MFYKRDKTLILITFIVKHKIVGMIVFEQRYRNDVLSVYMLFNDKVSKGFVDTLKFCVESTIVELYLFDDRGTFYVVMICSKI